MDTLLQANEFRRLANNFYNTKGLEVDEGRIAIDGEFLNYVLSHTQDVKKKYKVALCCICLNEPYWQFAKPMIEGAKSFFLPGHQTDIFLWSDMPQQTALPLREDKNAYADGFNDAIIESRKQFGATIFPTESIGWPYPTLMRYHLMLQQEEKLKEYDYVFYVDLDMLFVNIVGDEIFGELTAVQQPMYALRKEFIPPYEPNPDSASYIPRPGKIVAEPNGRTSIGAPIGKRFQPLYMAGGFQGGRTDKWIAAMKVMKEMIDKDMQKGYIPIWNDETVWNKFLFDNGFDNVTVLNPSYTYPDSLINEYFKPMWGRDYQPKLVTLSKKFTMTKEGGDHVAKTTQELASLK